MEKNILSINDLSVSYPDGNMAVNKLSLELEEGKRVARKDKPIIGSDGDS